MTGIFGALRLPASVVFGSGQRAAIGMMTAQIGKRALICTDARMGQDAQFKAIVADIEANGVATKVYDRTEADLPMEGISGCVTECADFKPDVVLGIGGGSCMDMATGLVSMGKIHDHANRGAPIPLGCALDENGDPTTDASAAKKGAIAPFGGPKGYALGIAFEVLVASLAASAIGTEVKGTLDSVNVSNKGDLFIVIAPHHAEAAKALVTAYLDDIRGAAPADPAHPVLAPGDRAHKVRSQSLAKGMFIDDGLWADLQKLAADSQKEKA